MRIFAKNLNYSGAGMSLFIGALLSLFGLFSERALSRDLSYEDLESGDILLQPLSCWACSLIEAQEGSIYSHMGVYLNLSSGPHVLEASQRVSLTPLKKFLSKTENGQRVKVMRFKRRGFKLGDLLRLAGPFIGLNYDSQFLFDNRDEAGELLYCSELVYKMFYPIYGEDLPLKRMRFDINYELWKKYFKTDPPVGEWGNAPVDFEKSHLLQSVGEL